MQRIDHEPDASRLSDGRARAGNRIHRHEFPKPLALHAAINGQATEQDAAEPLWQFSLPGQVGGVDFPASIDGNANLLKEDD
jgi:hypothetical protein